jgi:hypothetical protein
MVNKKTGKEGVSGLFEYWELFSSEIYRTLSDVLIVKSEYFPTVPISTNHVKNVQFSFYGLN